MRADNMEIELLQLKQVTAMYQFSDEEVLAGDEAISGLPGFFAVALQHMHDGPMARGSTICALGGNGHPALGQA